jgi:hypothetical protein
MLHLLCTGAGKGAGWESPPFSFPVSYCCPDKHAIIHQTNKLLGNLLGELYTNIPYNLIALSIIAVLF